MKVLFRRMWPSATKLLGPCLLVAIIAMSLVDAAAADRNEVGVSVAPARIDVGTLPNAADAITTIDITNTTNRQEDVTLKVVDVYVNSKGTFDWLAPGSTPYSIAPYLSLSEYNLRLQPAGQTTSTGRVQVHLRLDPAKPATYGGLLVIPLPGPTNPNKGPGINSEPLPQVLIPLVFAPLASDGGTQLAHSIKLAGLARTLTIESFTRRILDRLIPFDLPMIADHGPLLARSRVANSGNSYSRSFTHFSFHSVSPFGWLPQGLRAALGATDHDLLEADAPPAPTFPGMVALTTQTTEVTPQGIPFDVTPWIGLVRVHSTTRMVLIDAASKPIDQDTWILVFPWKLTLLLLLALMVWRLWRRRLRRG